MTSRYRSSDKPKEELTNHVLSSLDYFEKLNENGCEYRVFCELLVSASHMKNSEQHVENLLDNFAKEWVLWVQYENIFRDNTCIVINDCRYDNYCLVLKALYFFFINTVYMEDHQKDVLTSGRHRHRISNKKVGKTGHSSIKRKKYMVLILILLDKIGRTPTGLGLKLLNHGL